VLLDREPGGDGHGAGLRARQDAGASLVHEGSLDGHVEIGGELVDEAGMPRTAR